MRVVQAADQLDGKLDALARHDPCRLHHEQPALVNSYIRSFISASGGANAGSL